MGSDAAEIKAQAAIRETFDTVAAGYDHPSLRFFQASARRMADYFDSAQPVQILDVATGTGNAALTLARQLPLARVTGVDFSTGMLEQARAKASQTDIGNVEFREMDMQDLQFADGSFDGAVCAFGLFFVDDMKGLLRHIAEKIRPGGTVLISCFYEGSFSPAVDLFFDRIEHYGIERPPLRWKRIATEALCHDLFSVAGLQEIRVNRLNLGYYLESANAWWEVVWNGGFRGLVEQLPRDAVDRFRQEHLQEIEKLITTDGLWLNLEVLHVLGVKP